MKLNPIVFITPLIDFVVGKVIEAGTAGDGTKQLARAQEVIAINAALTLIDNGDITGAAALGAALANTTALSPGEALALQSLLAIIGNQLAALSTLAGSTLLGGTSETIVSAILAAGTTVAQAYVTKYSSSAPAVSASGALKTA